jgi:TPR repeat protein
MNGEQFFQIGDQFEFPKNGSPNYIKAEQYYLKASEMGDGRASFRLAQLYDDGKGVPKNLKMALQYYKLSAERGYPSGMAFYGWYLLENYKDRFHRSEGFQLIEKTASLNDSW